MKHNHQYRIMNVPLSYLPSKTLQAVLSRQLYDRVYVIERFETHRGLSTLFMKEEGWYYLDWKLSKDQAERQIKTLKGEFNDIICVGEY